MAFDFTNKDNITSPDENNIELVCWCINNEMHNHLRPDLIAIDIDGIDIVRKPDTQEYRFFIPDVDANVIKVNPVYFITKDEYFSQSRGPWTLTPKAGENYNKSAFATLLNVITECNDNIKELIYTHLSLEDIPVSDELIRALYYTRASSVKISNPGYSDEDTTYYLPLYGELHRYIKTVYNLMLKSAGEDYTLVLSTSKGKHTSLVKLSYVSHLSEENRTTITKRFYQMQRDAIKFLEWCQKEGRGYIQNILVSGTFCNDINEIINGTDLGYSHYGSIRLLTVANRVLGQYYHTATEPRYYNNINSQY